MVKEDLEYLLAYGTHEQRTQAIVKVARSKSIAAVPILDRLAQADPDPEIRELAAKAAKYIRLETPAMDEDDPDYPDYLAAMRSSSKPRSPLMTLVMGVLFMMAGMALFTILVFVEIDHQDFAERALLTTGFVVDLREVDGSEGSTYMPVIEFAAQNGEVYRIEASYSSSPPRFAIGDAVEVLYPPEVPYNGRLAVDNSIFTNVMYMVLIGVAIVLDLIGFAALIAWVRMGNKNKTQARVSTPLPLREQGKARAPQNQSLGGDGLPKEL